MEDKGLLKVLEIPKPALLYLDISQDSFTSNIADKLAEVVSKCSYLQFLIIPNCN